jgi:nucleoid-associated protein YejK
VRNYLLNIVRAVLGVSNEAREDRLFEAVEDYVTAESVGEIYTAFAHLKAMYEWYKEQE